MKNILVVDDHPEIREMLQQILTGAGYKVTTAENGLRLLSIIQADKIDLILLDIMMQWISGTDLCRSIRKNKKLLHTKIFFLSAKNQIADIRAGYDAGCDEYITKPFDPNLLLEKINRAFEK
ncbi:MAG: hypothetical protein A2096_10730 [Spirochaetes bacterium GWF1_41_5]|nr:MAG: hypothetical protein A2096_10730 [Spirochaetes bacterium GWF1_41_5]HBE01165.1 response regulator [Spirochaetia bacterium]